jgi:hypothetical protein
MDNSLPKLHEMVNEKDGHAFILFTVSFTFTQKWVHHGPHIVFQSIFTIIKIYVSVYF